MRVLEVKGGLEVRGHKELRRGGGEEKLRTEESL